MKSVHPTSPYIEDQEFYYILAGSFIFYLLLIFFFYLLPFDIRNPVLKQSAPARKITMVLPPRPVPRVTPPPPVVKHEIKKTPVPIVPPLLPRVEKIKPEPKKVISPPTREIPKETPEEIERKKEEALALQRAAERKKEEEKALQRARELEKNKEVAKNKFASLFGSANPADDVLEGKVLNVITTKMSMSNSLSANSPLKGPPPPGDGREEIQISMNTQDVEHILKGLPSGKDKKGTGSLGEHQTRNFGSGGNGSDGNGTGRIASIRTPEDFERTFKAYEGRLKSYYDRIVQTDPSFKGKMRVRITIAADGHVLQCEVLSSQFKNKNFENEVAKIIKEQFRFSKIAQGEEYYDRSLNFHREDQ